MSSLTFAYEIKKGERYAPNGLREGSKYFQRWVDQVEEYSASDCGNPLKTIIRATRVPFEEQSLSTCLEQNKKFIYPVEILRSNHAWLLPRLYEEHSPWPAISEEAKKAFRQGKAFLLLTHLKWQSDSDRGDPVRHGVFKKLHAALEHFHIPPSAVIYVGASPELKDIYKNLVVTENITEPLKTVEHINYLEKGWQLYFEGYRQAGEIFDEALSPKDQARRRSHKFLCFNHEPRSHRKLNLMWLWKNNLLQENLVSFYPEEHLLKFEKENPLPVDPEFEQLLSEFDSFTNRLPLIVDAPQGLHISFCKRWPFADTYFSFLTERVFDCQSGWTLLTPKVFKAMCNSHPFIVLGQHGYLEALHRLGYKTFAPFINEDYDKISEPIRRTKAVWQEVLRLQSLSLEELHQWYYSLLPILQHNLQIFLKRGQDSEYDRFIRYLKEVHEL